MAGADNDERGAGKVPDQRAAGARDERDTARRALRVPQRRRRRLGHHRVHHQRPR